jgi:CTP synthase (UTP-ammonia lyase)
VATLAAIEHAAVALGLDVDARVLSTYTLGDLAEVLFSSALVVGSPYRDPDAVLTSIRLARERGIPLVGT